MSPGTRSDVMLSEFDEATRALVRLSCALAAGSEDDVRAMLQQAAGVTPHEWIEELVLQTYLFAGFPRALNGMREWRRLRASPATRENVVGDSDVRVMGEGTCRSVYGSMYERLRGNIRQLHPALDTWMIMEGYGKVLSRPGLDLPRRELCIVAACAATGQDRQLQSHLHGAQNVGVDESVITATLEAIRDIVAPASWSRATRLWDRIR